MGLVLHHTEFVAAYLPTPVSKSSTRHLRQFHLPWEPADVTRIRGGEDAAEDAEASGAEDPEGAALAAAAVLDRAERDRARGGRGLPPQFIVDEELETVRFSGNVREDCHPPLGGGSRAGVQARMQRIQALRRQYSAEHLSLSSTAAEKVGGEEWEKRVVGEPQVVGNGTFGVVFAALLESGQTVAIKRVLQDPRYRNRELAIMKQLKHPNIVPLLHYYHARSPANQVMEFLPSTLHRCIQSHASSGGPMNLQTTKIVSWQVLRALAYLHRQHICHRDLKPQNILLDTKTLVAKLCDMGSAKKLHAGSTSVAYICSRLYRSPELILGATEYTTAIDMWSFGCVLAEMLLSRPLFPADDSPRQILSISRVIGPPDASSILGMKVNESHRALEASRRVQVVVEGWELLRKHKAPLEAADLLSQLLVYKPHRRLGALQCLSHPFFDSLRQAADSKEIPPLFDFTDDEIAAFREAQLLDKVLPPNVGAKWREMEVMEGSPVTSLAASS